MSIEQLTIDTIRFLSLDAIERAKSGHPGLPMGAAPAAYTLYSRHLNHNPFNPDFINRDRFVLSAGHGSILLYSILHLFGYDLSIEDIKNFRQLGSRTPGHPEFGLTPGIETSTGPLGQGIANAVGMAVAETHLAAKFNRDGYNIIDHYTYAFCGDGCMMEGIEYEAASLAGSLKLGKLIVFYDDNNITIEGNTDLTFTEDVAARHEAQGWHVQRVADGNSIEEIDRAITEAKKISDKPHLITIKTTIGYGTPLAGSENSHGAPLGAENVAKTRENFKWNYEAFKVPDEVYTHTRALAQKGAEAEKKWNSLLKEYSFKYPSLHNEFTAWMSGRFPNMEKDEVLWRWEKADATRNMSGIILNHFAKHIPNLFGGSADLGPSNKSIMTGRTDYSAYNRAGSNIHYGIREHAMTAVMNGLQVHGGIKAYCATFFVFSDYMKNAIRMSALMHLPVTYILTHDSIGVGEDGPTHQPVEQLVGLRSIPNLKVWRPCDGIETACAWLNALEPKNPTALILSRQNLPQCGGSKDAARGGYVLKESIKNKPDAIIIATGSEVALALAAREELNKSDISVRVVSMPCIEVFETQDEDYKESVLPSDIRARVAVEAGSSHGWYKYVGIDGAVVGMDCFGVSAPSGELFNHFGFTVTNIIKKVTESINKGKCRGNRCCN